MTESKRLLVSLVVPTYNEEEDIARTMDALAAQIYQPIEVVVVDASQDRTPEIVQSYKDHINLKFIRQRPKPGVSVARNDGLRAATGEIVVILNADVYPEPDFVEQIVPYYQKEDVDYLSVDSLITNTDYLFPRYLQSQHHYNLDQNPQEIIWTEGFSCRLEAARAVGGFPEVFGHNTAGEDDVFTAKLAAHYIGATDFSIVVPHVAPIAFDEYWRQRMGRGRGGAYRLYAFEKRPLRWGAILRSVLGTLFLTVILIPGLAATWKLLRYSPRGWRDWLPFTWARMVEMAATAVGYWTGSREIAKKGLNQSV